MLLTVFERSGEATVWLNRWRLQCASQQATSYSCGACVACAVFAEAHQLHALMDALRREVLERLVEALEGRDGEAVVELDLEGANLRRSRARVRREGAALT